MVGSWHCVDRVVSEAMSQVSRRSEVGNHKWRTLNTRLSSALLQELSHIQRDLQEIIDPKQVRKTNRTGILYRIQKKRSKIGPHVSNPRSRWVCFGFRSTHYQGAKSILYRGLVIESLLSHLVETCVSLRASQGAHTYDWISLMNHLALPPLREPELTGSVPSTLTTSMAVPILFYSSPNERSNWRRIFKFLLQLE